MRKIFSLFLLITVLCSSVLPSHVYAQALTLPMPGAMVNVSETFNPVLMKGLQVHPDNPFLFDFILDRGDVGARHGVPEMSSSMQGEAQKLIKYFLCALTIPEKDLWVNLSPYEKDRMMPLELEKTELGRDMLAQDYILKQVTASLVYPEKDLGKQFWNKVYAQVREKFGNVEVPTDTFNKVWLVADKADVYVHDNTAFVVGAHLKVMLESDYLAAQDNLSATRGHSAPEGGSVSPSTQPSDAALDMKATQVADRMPHQELAKQILREVIIPILEKEVNEGKNFANLRQIFHGMILATWYKKNLKEALLNQVYSNKNKTSGVTLGVTNLDPQGIYSQYVEAYKKGVFNLIKEDVLASGETIPRKYFSGGTAPDLGADNVLRVVGKDAIGDFAMKDMVRVEAGVKVADAAMIHEAGVSSGLSRTIRAIVSHLIVQEVSVFAEDDETAIMEAKQKVLKDLHEEMKRRGLAWEADNDNVVLSALKGSLMNRKVRLWWADREPSQSYYDKPEGGLSTEELAILGWESMNVGTLPGEGSDEKSARENIEQRLMKRLESDVLHSGIRHGGNAAPFVKRIRPYLDYIIQQTSSNYYVATLFVKDAAMIHAAGVKVADAAMMGNEKDFEFLIQEATTQDELKRIYRKMARTFHPDIVSEDLKETARLIFIRLSDLIKTKLDKVFNIRPQESSASATKAAANDDWLSTWSYTAYSRADEAARELKRRAEFVKAKGESDLKLVTALVLDNMPSLSLQQLSRLLDITSKALFARELLALTAKGALVPDVVTDEMIWQARPMIEKIYAARTLTKGEIVHFRKGEQILRVVILEPITKTNSTLKVVTLSADDYQIIDITQKQLIGPEYDLEREPLQQGFELNIGEMFEIELSNHETFTRKTVIATLYGVAWGAFAFLAHDVISQKTDYMGGRGLNMQGRFGIAQFRAGKIRKIMPSRLEDLEEETPKLVGNTLMENALPLKAGVRADDAMASILSENFLDLSFNDAVKAMMQAADQLRVKWENPGITDFGNGFLNFVAKHAADKGVDQFISSVFLGLLEKDAKAEFEEGNRRAYYEVIHLLEASIIGINHYRHGETFIEVVVDSPDRFRTIKGTWNNLAPDLIKKIILKAQDAAMMPIPKWPSTVPQTSDTTLKDKIAKGIIAAHLVLMKIQADVFREGKTKEAALNLLLNTLRVLTPEDGVLFEKAVSDVEKIFGRPMAQSDLMEHLLFIRRVLFNLNISYFVQNGWLIDIGNHEGRLSIRREQVKYYDVIQDVRHPVLLIQAESNDSSFPGYPVLYDSIGSFIDPGVIILGELSNEQLDEEYETHVTFADNEEVKSFSPSIARIVGHLKGVSKQAFRDIYKADLLQEEWGHYQEFRERESRQAGSMNIFNPEQLREHINITFPESSNNQAVKMIRNIYTLFDEFHRKNGRTMGAEMLLVITETSRAVQSLYFSPSYEAFLVSLANIARNIFSRDDVQRESLRMAIYPLELILKGDLGPQAEVDLDGFSQKLQSFVALPEIAKLSPQELYEKVTALGDFAMSGQKAIEGEFPDAMSVWKKVALDKAGVAVPPGGIDLNAQKMQLNEKGAKIDMAFDPVMAAQFKRGDFTGLMPVIYRITPISDPKVLLGLN